MVFAETSVISLSVAFTFLVYACEYYTQGGSVIGPSIEWNLMQGSRYDFLSILLHQQVFKKLEIYPPKTRNLQYFRP